MSPRANLLRFQTSNHNSTDTKFRRVRDETFEGPDLREFPIGSSPPVLPTSIPDEILDLYAFLYCQRGFRYVDMTFEQFLLVIATVVPGGLSATTG